MPPALLMLLAGVGIPVMAALNARLGGAIGSPAAAGVVLFAVALAAAGALCLWEGPGALARVAGQPPHLLAGGLVAAFYVLSITYVAPTFGVGNAVFLVLLGQLASSAAIDHWGLFGAPPAPVGARRAAGIALMAAGVALARGP